MSFPGLALPKPPTPWTDLDTGQPTAAFLLYMSKLDGAVAPFPVPVLTGAITGASQVKTANYPVTNSDKGSTLTINNNVYTTFSAGAASGYDADFQVRIYNGNANAGILISFPGVSFPANSILYPGQAIVIQNINNVWSLQNPPGRWQRPNLTFFVDPSLGNDTTADGLSTGSRAFSTIPGAISNLSNVADIQTVTPTIQLAAATYTINSPINVNYPLVGRSQFVIRGDPSSFANAQNFQINMAAAGALFAARDLSTLTLEGLFLNATVGGAGAISASNDSTVDADTCVFGSFPGGTVISAATGGHFNFLTPCQMLGNATAMVVATSGGTIVIPVAIDLAAITFGNFAVASSCGVIDASAASFTGAGSGGGSIGTQWTVATAGGLIKGGVTIPGTVAGTTTAPGWIG